MFALLLEVRILFRLAGARNPEPWQKGAKSEDFVAVSKTMAGLGHLKRIWKDAWCVEGAVQEAHGLDVLGDQIRAEISCERLHFRA